MAQGKLQAVQVLSGSRKNPSSQLLQKVSLRQLEQPTISAEQTEHSVSLRKASSGQDRQTVELRQVMQAGEQGRQSGSSK